MSVFAPFGGGGAPRGECDEGRDEGSNRDRDEDGGEGREDLGEERGSAFGGGNRWIDYGDA